MSLCRLELIQPIDNGELPVERSGHRVLVDESNMYVLGGYNPDVVDSDVEDEEELCKRIFIQMWRFNFFYRRWRQLKMAGQCPQYLASHSASLHGKTLLTFGGSGIPFGTRSSQSLHMCQLDGTVDTLHWSVLPATGDIPPRKYGQCQLYQWPYLYIVGGTTGFIYNTDVHRYNLQTGEWTCLWDSLLDIEEAHHNCPEGRYRHEMVLHNQQLLMLGGGQARCAFPLDKVPYFDLVSCRWKEHQTTPDVMVDHVGGGDDNIADDDDNDQKGFPVHRRCHSCVHYGNGVYLFGGRNEDTPLGDLWRLCLDTLHWTCLVQSHSSPFTRFFHSAHVTPSGAMYIFGGVTWDEEGEDDEDAAIERRTRDVHRFQLGVPPLQEMVWDYLSHCLRSSLSSAAVHYPEESLPVRLLEMGVPRHFAQRLCP